MRPYEQGQCTDFCAKFWLSNFQSEALFFDGSYGRHAKAWPTKAIAAGMPTTDTPQVGDVACFTWVLPYGHVAIVTAVHADGTIDVIESNWVKPLTIGTREHIQGAPIYLTHPSSNPEFENAWEEMKQKGIYTEYTKHDGQPFSKEETAVILSRALKIPPSMVPIPPSPPQV